MKREVVFDMEGDGLRDECSKVWCLVARDINTKDSFVWASAYGLERHSSDIAKFFGTCSKIIGHNIIDYDLPVLSRLLGVIPRGEIFDTLVTSRLLWPDRPVPKGCSSGAHSVEAWGIRFGVPKPEHEDWTKYSADMLYRCEQDVIIQERIYFHLLEEMGK